MPALPSSSLAPSSPNSTSVPSTFMAEVVHIAALSGPSAIKTSISTPYVITNGDLLTRYICHCALTGFLPFLLFPTSSHGPTVAVCCTKATMLPLMEISPLLASLGPHFKHLAHAISPSQCPTYKWWELQCEVFSGCLPFTAGTHGLLGNVPVWDVFIPVWNSKCQWTGFMWLTSTHKSSGNSYKAIGKSNTRSQTCEVSLICYPASLIMSSQLKTKS